MKLLTITEQGLFKELGWKIQRSKELKRMRQEYNELDLKIQRLKELEIELNSLNIDGLESKSDAIKLKLKNPKKVEEVEKDIATLRSFRKEEEQFLGSLFAKTNDYYKYRSIEEEIEELLKKYFSCWELYKILEIERKKIFDRSIEHIKLGHTSQNFVNDVRNFAKKHKFSVESVDSALEVGYTAEFRNFLNSIRYPYQEDENREHLKKDATEFAEKHGFPVIDVYKAYEEGKKPPPPPPPPPDPVGDCCCCSSTLIKQQLMDRSGGLQLKDLSYKKSYSMKLKIESVNS